MAGLEYNHEVADSLAPVVDIIDPSILLSILLFSGLMAAIKEASWIGRA